MKESNKKIFYLFSTNLDKKPCESICICDKGDTVGTPLYQTGIYPLGSFLTKIIRITKPWIENPIYSESKEEQLETLFNNFDTGDFSFSSIINSDSNAYRLLNLLLIPKWNPMSKRNSHDIFYLLVQYMNFITDCQTNSELYDSKFLRAFIYQQNDKFPNNFIYLPTILGKKSQSPQHLYEATIGLPFTPKYKDHPVKQLFINQNSYPHFIKTKWEPLTLPLNVYEINDVIDLFLVSLTLLFEYHYIFKQCKYCKNIFVTHRANQQYCPFLFSESNLKSKSCQRQYNIRLQIERERSGRRKAEKNLSSTYRIKFGNSGKEYLELLDFFL